MTYYEIFPSLADAEAKTENINRLLEYPNGAETYRENFPHPGPEDNRACGIVDQLLIDACTEMTPAERLNYYNSANLHTLSYIYEQGWFPDE